MGRRAVTITAVSMLTAACAAVAEPPGRGSAASSSVQNSTISNKQGNATVTDKDNSTVNTGVAVRGSSVKDSSVSSNFSGKVAASNDSSVTTGISIGGEVSDSNLSSNVSADVTAKSGAKVGVGSIDVKNSRSVQVSTQVQGKIDATAANVKVGAVEAGSQRTDILVNTQVGQVNAQGGTMSIGTVTVNSALAGGNSSNSTSLMPEGKLSGQVPGDAEKKVATVEINSPTVREVEVIMGEADEKIGKAVGDRHNASLYKSGEVAPDGTLYMYVSKDEYEKAIRDGKSFGNVKADDTSIKRVKVFVDK